MRVTPSATSRIRRGGRFFFDEPGRLDALARSLGCTPDLLREKRDQLAGRRTLVLDPRLPAQVRDRLTQIGRDTERFLVACPTDADDARAALQQLAESAENPIVVLSEPEDVQLFQFAKIDCSLLEHVPRGMRLTAFPDLVPLTPARPPRRFDDDGVPLLPIDASTAQPPPRHHGNTRFHDQVVARYVKPALEREEVPCLPLDVALAWLTNYGSGGYSEYDTRIHVVERPRPALAHFEDVNRSNTQVWHEAGKIYAIGARRDEVRRLLAPHHEVHEPAWVTQLEDALRDVRVPKTLT